MDPIIPSEMSQNPIRVNRLTLVKCFFFAFHFEVRLKKKKN